MNILISNTSEEPIYKQIARQIKDMIIRGVLKEGELLFSIRNMAKELGISVITVKKAYEELEREGYIVTTQGKGTFVAVRNRELLREMRLKVVEEKLEEAVFAGKSLGLSLEEMTKMLEILYGEV
ncbi:GntR family transcriptional regulator [Thermovorax subterraneus]|nr:GntR family transcriptional regulator [Thermovorax subterraneus]